MALEIVKPGLSTTVQDLGRHGYYHLGIPESGAMDKSSLAAANRRPKSTASSNPAGPRSQ
jgi:allophanate hydrolase subunit 2